MRAVARCYASAKAERAVNDVANATNLAEPLEADSSTPFATKGPEAPQATAPESRVIVACSPSAGAPPAEALEATMVPEAPMRAKESQLARWATEASIASEASSSVASTKGRASTVATEATSSWAASSRLVVVTVVIETVAAIAALREAGGEGVDFGPGQAVVDTGNSGVLAIVSGQATSGQGASGMGPIAAKSFVSTTAVATIAALASIALMSAIAAILLEVHLAFSGSDAKGQS